MEQTNKSPYQKKIQAEKNLVGSISPNIEMVHQTALMLNESFDHKHGTITERDSILMISQYVVGKPVNDPTADGLGLTFLQVGCFDHQVSMVKDALKHRKEFARIVQKALVELTLEGIDEVMDNGNPLPGLASVLKDLEQHFKTPTVRSKWRERMKEMQQEQERRRTTKQGQ